MARKHKRDPVLIAYVVRGPARVLLIDGELLSEAGDSAMRKPCSHFQRQWAGPLDRPVGIPT